MFYGVALTRSRSKTVYTSVCLIVDGVSLKCTDGSGTGDPFLIGDQIIFRIPGQHASRVELVWPSGFQYAQIAELSLLTEGDNITTAYIVNFVLRMEYKAS